MSSGINWALVVAVIAIIVNTGVAGAVWRALLRLERHDVRLDVLEVDVKEASETAKAALYGNGTRKKRS